MFGMDERASDVVECHAFAGVVRADKHRQMGRLKDQRSISSRGAGCELESIDHANGASWLALAAAVLVNGQHGRVLPEDAPSPIPLGSPSVARLGCQAEAASRAPRQWCCWVFSAATPRLGPVVSVAVRWLDEVLGVAEERRAVIGCERLIVCRERLP
jgi:hypothetical protein